MTEPADFFGETDAEDETTPEFLRNRIANYVNQVREIDGEIEVLENQVKVLKGQKDDLELKKIPDALLESGLSEITTMEGLKVSTALFVGSIPKENKDTAFAWMDSHGHGSLIKRQVSVQFDKGSTAAAQKAIVAIKELGLDPKESLDVHYQTWKAFAKEQTKKGIQIPFEAWGVFVGQRAQIKG